jgi:hypothetical protein
MFSLSRTCRILAALFAVAYAGYGGSARASLTLSVTVTNGPASTTIVDNMAGDLNPAVNAIRFVQTVGSFQVTGNVSTNNPGTAAMGQLLTSYTANRLNSTNPGSVSFDASQMGFTAPGSAGNTMRLDSTLVLLSPLTSPGSFATLQSFGDAATTGLQSFAAVHLPATDTAPPAFFVRGGSYSLEARSTAQDNGGGTVTFTGTTKATLFAAAVVPEPTSALVFVAVLSTALAWGWRSRRPV